MGVPSSIFLHLQDIYTERQKPCTTLPIVICILFQTMAFENNELSMNRQVSSKRFYASAVKLSKQCIVAEFTKMLKTLNLTQKSNQSDFRRKLWLFYVCMMFVMRKTEITLNRFVL